MPTSNSRQQETLKLAEDLLTDIELNRLGEHQMLLKTLRLARLTKNAEFQGWLNMELQGYPKDRQAVAISVGRRFVADDERIVVYAPLTEITSLRDAEISRLEALSTFTVSGEWANVQGDKQRQAIANSAAQRARLDRVISSVIAHIYQRVTEIHHELLFSELQAELFEATRVEIDARLTGPTGGALGKVEGISDRLRDGDTEAIAQAMSSCRRLIDAAAEIVFPPQEGEHVVDGQPLKVGAGQVKNRLASFLFDLGLSKGRRDRLRRTINDLYDRTSTGVHAEVTIHEARYIFLHTYIVLGEVLTAASGDQASP